MSRLTTTVQEYMAEGYGLKFERLLADWGVWARGGGIQGYYSGGARATESPVFIDDVSALQVDHAVAQVRPRRPRLHYRIFDMYYRRGLDAQDILATIRRHKVLRQLECGCFEVGEIDATTISFMVQFFGRLVFEELRGEA